MEKKVILSVVAIVLVACVLTGVTVAYFTDTEKSTGNVFAAGTLDLEVRTPNLWDYVTFNITNAKPGDTNSASPLNIEMKNVGSIDGTKLTVKLENIANDGGELTAPEKLVDSSNNGDLCKNVTLSLYDETDLVNPFFSKPLTDGAWNTGVSITGGISHNATRNFKAIYTVDSNAANEIQGDICTFNISATLEQ